MDKVLVVYLAMMISTLAMVPTADAGGYFSFGFDYHYPRGGYHYNDRYLDYYDYRPYRYYPPRPYRGRRVLHKHCYFAHGHRHCFWH